MPLSVFLCVWKTGEKETKNIQRYHGSFWTWHWSDDFSLLTTGCCGVSRGVNMSRNFRKYRLPWVLCGSTYFHCTLCCHMLVNNLIFCRLLCFPRDVFAKEQLLPCWPTWRRQNCSGRGSCPTDRTGKGEGYGLMGGLMSIFGRVWWRWSSIFWDYWWFLEILEYTTGRLGPRKMDFKLDIYIHNISFTVVI